MTQTDPQKRSPTPPAAADEDPLARLHKMSRTAGLGSGDYVAINGWAIFALLLGIASALTLFEEPVLLIIPLTGVIASVIALRQISRSGGTQTGRGMAATGLVLSLALGGVVMTRLATENARTRADRVALGEMLVQLGEDLRADNFDGSYERFTPRFRERIDHGAFVDRMKFVQQSDFYGELVSVSWTGLAQFQPEEATGGKTGVVMMRMHFDEGAEIRGNVLFRQIDGRWYFDDIPILFPPERPD